MVKVGRPLKFGTRKELEEAIDKYFEDTPFKDYSVTGLALIIGSKQLLDDYQKRKDFGDIVKRAKLIVENSYELSLREHGRSGDIFALKNFGWSDKTEVEHSGQVTVMPAIEIDGKPLKPKVGDKD